MAQWAKASGVKNIILAARTDDKVEFARKLGFSLAVNAKRDSLSRLVEEVTNGLGADACIEGTGAPEPWAECISLAKAGGRVVCLGNPLGGMSLSQDVYWKILRKELTLVGTWNSSFGSRESDWREAVQAMQDKRLDLKSLITHRFSLAEYMKAFSLMHDRREMYCKMMFVF